MLRRIESISNAAVWSSYDGQASTAPDFGRYNLIYGWNASGKTTLSRVFDLFGGTGGTRLPTSARILVSVGNEVLDSAREQDRSRIMIRVFNRDFIDANLQRDDYTHAPALFIVGQENIRLSNRIEVLTRRRERLAGMYRTIQKRQSDVQGAREKAATDLARDCGTMLGVRDFRAPNLKALAEGLPNTAEHLLDEITLQAAVAQARDQGEFAPLRNFPMVASSELPKIDDVTYILAGTWLQLGLTPRCQNSWNLYRC